jgi:predicted nucleic acid-binding protein
VIAADTSTWVAYLEGETGEDVQLLDRALKDHQAVMLPVVLSELLSDPGISPAAAKILIEMPLIRIEPGCWQRTGFLRAKVLKMKRRARLADSLIAQSCIDLDIPLLTRDRDLQMFSEAAGVHLMNKH